MVTVVSHERKKRQTGRDKERGKEKEREREREREREIKRREGDGEKKRIRIRKNLLVFGLFCFSFLVFKGLTLISCLTKMKRSVE